MTGKHEADATTKNAQTNRYNAKMKLMELQLQDKKLNFEIDYPGMGDVAGSVMKKAYSRKTFNTPYKTVSRVTN